MATPNELEADWVHAIFAILREEVVSIAADFGDRVKREIDAVAATHEIQPPSATALLTSVALETGNIAVSLLRKDDTTADDDEENT